MSGLTPQQRLASCLAPLRRALDLLGAANDADVERRLLQAALEQLPAAKARLARGPLTPLLSPSAAPPPDVILELSRAIVRQPSPFGR